MLIEDVILDRQIQVGVEFEKSFAIAIKHGLVDNRRRCHEPFVELHHGGQRFISDRFMIGKVQRVAKGKIRCDPGDLVVSGQPIGIQPEFGGLKACSGRRFECVPDW